MGYDARVVKVMIASPGDVSTERQVVRDVLTEWNNIHSEDRKLVLMGSDGKRIHLRRWATGPRQS
jgi:hypothetical protein